MHQKWFHNPGFCQLSWWLKARIKLANGTGTFLALCPMITHVAHCRTHKFIARRTFVIARFHIALLIRLAKLRLDIVLNLPHEHKWTPKTRAPNYLNWTVCGIHGWGKNRTVCVIRGWGKNRTICAIHGRTCLLYNNYTVYSYFWWWCNTTV